MADAIFTNGVVRIEVGNSGTQGPAGADGTDGTDGAQGPVGPQGPPGPAGTDGADGADGAQGPAGMDGAAGIDGEPGATGPRGPDGLQGIQGQQGLQGPAGEQGLTGPPGADGADGGQGIQGPQGDPGPAGTTQWNGITGRPAIYSYFAIWAEETTNLITNNFQFSFGNGNPTTDGSGIVLPFNCDLIAMSASFEVAGTATIVVRRNSSSPQNIILQNSRHGYNDFEANPVACTAGDIINFQTTFVTGQVHGVVVTAWFRRLVA